MRGVTIRGALAAGVVLAGSGVALADLASPSGPVVLTVYGEIEETNRGPLDPAVDKLMAFHELEFEAAAAFDLVMLEGLGMETRAFTLETLPDLQELEGPTLAALLEAVGAEADEVTIVALDGYTVELDAATVGAHDWILGLKRNGSYLGIGGFGPAWAVFTPAAGHRPSADEAALWPYQAFVIRVGG